MVMAYTTLTLLRILLVSEVNDSAIEMFFHALVSKNSTLCWRASCMKYKINPPSSYILSLVHYYNIPFLLSAVSLVVDPLSPPYCPPKLA